MRDRERRIRAHACESYMFFADDLIRIGVFLLLMNESILIYIYVNQMFMCLYFMRFLKVLRVT